MIHPATLGDLWTLRRKPRSSVMLYTERLLARPHRPLLTAIHGLLQARTRNGVTLVARERNHAAFAQTLRRAGRAEQDIVMLSAYGGGRGTPTDADAWFKLLDALCFYAGRSHVERVYAALSQRHEELRELFRQIGFTAYTHQTVLRLQGPDWDQGTSLARMRPQHRADIWAIHKLYGAITPRPVQQIEARDSRSWMLPRSRPWQPVTPLRGWVLGQQDEISAGLRLYSGPAAHVLTLLLHPDRRELLADVLRFGLGQIGDNLPVYLLLRDYQRELLLPAEDLGFQPIGEQQLFCKQTTVTARRSVLAPVLEPVLEPRPLTTIASHKEEKRS